MKFENEADVIVLADVMMLANVMLLVDVMMLVVIGHYDFRYGIGQCVS